MIELQENIYLVPGRNGSLFPYCNGLYLRGRSLRILVDAGMGREGIDECVRAGIDVLILSHCHYDHRSTIGEIPDVPVWSHPLDAPYIEDREHFLAGVGLTRSGLDFRKIFRNLPSQRIRISRMLRDGERIEAGGLTVEIVHIPGHTPGQIALHLPRARFLFTADVSLHPFGPFYGHDFADIEASIASIRTLKRIGAQIVLTGHCGPFTDEIDRRFEMHESVIHERDRRIINLLSQPREIENLLGRGLIYPNTDRLTRFMKWFERVHLEKHLERLERAGKVRKEGLLFQSV